MNHTNYTYTYTKEVEDDRNTIHRWCISTEAGAKDAWVATGPGADEFGVILGGIETHWATRPVWATDGPCHACCIQLGGRPCWHDGSSRLFEDLLGDAWVRCGRNPRDRAFEDEVIRVLIDLHSHTFGDEA